MKIMALDSPGSGSFWYRTKMPFDLMNRIGGYEAFINDSARNAPFSPEYFDIIQFARAYYDAQVMEDVLLESRHRGVKIIVDIDDALDLVDPTNFVYNQTMSSLSNYFFQLINADLITCTGPALAKHLAKFTSKPIKIIPNYIDFKVFENAQQNLPQRPKTMPRIGFAGSSTHLPETLMVMEAIIEIQKEADVEFQIFGWGFERDPIAWADRNLGLMQDRQDHPLRPIFEQFKELCAQLKNFTFEPVVPVEYYYNRLWELNWDIGLAPVPNTEFGACKSGIKFYEYAAMGIIPIASDTPNFDGCEDAPINMFVDNTVKNWVKAIQVVLYGLTKNTGPVKLMIEENRQWAFDKWSLENNFGFREQIYAELIQK
jgi:hypothetical protein